MRAQCPPRQFSERIPPPVRLGQRSGTSLANFARNEAKLSPPLFVVIAARRTRQFGKQLWYFEESAWMNLAIRQNIHGVVEYSVHRDFKIGRGRRFRYRQRAGTFSQPDNREINVPSWRQPAHRLPARPA